MRTEITEKIFSVAGDSVFQEAALEIFRFQASECPLYNEYIRLLGIDAGRVDNILSIPFMPISFFREHTVMTGGKEPEAIFLSSGTAGMRRSRHAVADMRLYDESLRITSYNVCYTKLLRVPSFLRTSQFLQKLNPLEP